MLNHVSFVRIFSSEDLHIAKAHTLTPTTYLSNRPPNLYLLISSLEELQRNGLKKINFVGIREFANKRKINN